MLELINISIDLKGKSGVYKLSTEDNKIYIGSAKCFYTRFKNHLSTLRRNKHPNNYLQNSFNSGKRFIVDIVEECDLELLLTKEQYYIDTLKPEYNFCKTAGNKSGTTLSQETKDKISKSLMGHIGAMNGRIHSEESKVKMSLANTGKIRTEKTKKQLSEITKEFWRNNPNHNSKVDNEDILNLHNLGKGTCEIASILGINRCTVTNRKKKLNLI